MGAHVSPQYYDYDYCDYYYYYNDDDDVDDDDDDYVPYKRQAFVRQSNTSFMDTCPTANFEPSIFVSVCSVQFSSRWYICAQEG